jgi:hypothetical protein
MRNDTHPAAPEQTKHGFDEGQGRRPRKDAQRRVGRFSEGLEERPPDHSRGRFSEGQERRPGAPENEEERRFSEGLEDEGSAG